MNRLLSSFTGIGLRILAGAVAGTLAGTTALGAQTGDPARGAEIYERCLACHAVARDRVGPRHCGLSGRKAGGLTGFPYSQAFRNLDVEWNRDTLDRFLTAPTVFAPGTSMAYYGVKDAKERADLISYLLSLPPCD